MMHRINIKDTPRLLEIALQPPEVLNDTFWIAGVITNVIFESTQDESMPEKNSGKLCLDLTRTAGVIYECSACLFTVGPAGTWSVMGTPDNLGSVPKNGLGGCGACR